MTKQAIKKGAGTASVTKKVGLAAFKEKKGMVYHEGDNIQNTVSNANKPLDWLIMPKAFSDATRLPGLPNGVVISVLGHSNVGKSTLLNHAIVAAQRQGYIPVIFDTENAFSFTYAKQMGMEAEPIYGDVEVEVVNPETGEVTIETRNEIVSWDGNFLYYDNKRLIEQYGKWDYSQGKEVQKRRNMAVIEDVAMCINELLDAQEDGEIDMGFLFVWDSVGSLSSFKTYNAKGVGNAMWDAGAISVAFNRIVNDRIPSSRKVSSKYTNTFLYVNKVWMDAMTNPVGPAIMQTKGGKSLKYSTRLEILLGGQLTAGIKRLTATYKGLDYSYGIETKIKILKNHLDAPHNVCYEGKMIASDCGFIAPDELDEYRKNHIGDILKQLQEISNSKETIDIKQVEFTEKPDSEYEQEN